VEVVQVTPSTISVTFERSARKLVPVVPEVEGEPAAGFETGTVAAEPAAVEVIGPTSALAGLASAITETVSVAGATAPVVEMVNVGVTDPAVRLASAQAVRVTVNVAPARHEWAVRGVRVKALNGDRRTEVMPDVVTVHLRGPRDAMGADAASFEATIDTAGLPPGQYVLPVRVVLPARTGLTRVDPAEVTVKVQ
jgi:YbbR domain-containing protein